MWQAGNEPDITVSFLLDAEKAFDRMEWAYLFESLKKLGVGFIDWVRLLYYNPKASVVTNGRRSLAIAIRQNNNIVSIEAGGKEHKLLLYTDNILLLCRRPSTTLLHILTLIHSFSGVSGYKINWSKSEAMPLSRVCPPSVGRDGSFHGSHLA